MFRSLIFVPGVSARFVEKAKTLAADVICFDLEDSVPANEKENARAIISEAIASHRKEYARPVYVRVNAPDSGMIASDLNAVLKEGIDGIVVPKVNTAEELVEVTQTIASFEQSHGIEEGEQAGESLISIIPSIETASGVVNAYEIARSDKRIQALVFGVFDYLYDMKLDYDEHDPSGYKYARAKVPVDARAAGVAAIDAIWQKVDDIEGLKKDAEIARRLGYSGKSLVHPSQIEPVHSIFKPGRNEIEWARKVVKALAEANEKGTGRGAVRLEGRMVDAVHYKQAKAILDEAGS